MSLKSSPLAEQIVFSLGPVPISQPVVTTWVIMLALCLVCWLGLRGRATRGGALQTMLEVIVVALATQVEDVIKREPWPYLPLLGSLFVFLVVANLCAVIPGVSPPTAHIETPAALALIVFVSVHYFGVRALGPGAYLHRYVKPSVLLLPLNVLSEITRTFSLMIRLFGNIMSHEFVLSIVVFLAGLLLPVPFMLFGILIGLIQGYIFMILSAVFIGAAIESIEA